MYVLLNAGILGPVLWAMEEKKTSKHFNNITGCIDNTKVYQISMDGPAVNHNFLEMLSKTEI